MKNLLSTINFKLLIHGQLPEIKKERINYKQSNYQHLPHHAKCLVWSWNIETWQWSTVRFKKYSYCSNSFIDTYDLPFVCGRLKNSNLAYDTRYPIILARTSKFTDISVHYTNKKYFHASRLFSFAFLQFRFQIRGDKIAFHVRGRRGCRPFFSFSSVDFAGPFMINWNNHKSVKFLICLSTRAVHFGSVSDLPKNVFIVTFIWFIARSIPNTLTVVQIF